MVLILLTKKVRMGDQLDISYQLHFIPIRDFLEFSSKTKDQIHYPVKEISRKMTHIESTRGFRNEILQLCQSKTARDLPGA